MSYLSSTKTKKRSPERKPVLFIVVIVFLLSLSLFSPLKSTFETLAIKTQGSEFFYKIFSWFHFKSGLLKDREYLKEVLAKNTVLEDEIEILKEENVLLRQIKKPQDKEILAEVILHPGFSPYDVLVLNVGEDTGISLGDLVFYQSLLIGEISEVNTSRSKVSLFSSGDKTFPVRIGVHESELEARGLGSGTFEVIVPKTLEVNINDKVKISLGAPRYLGVVLDIESEESNAFQRVLFSLPININHIRFVSVSPQKDL